MEKQNDMMLARRRNRKKARFEDSCSIAKRLLEESAANDTLHQTAHEEDKNKQGDMVSQLGRLMSALTIF